MSFQSGVLYYHDVDTDTYLPVDGHDGVAHFADYRTALGMGKVSGHNTFRGLGRRVSLTTATTGNDIWEGAAIAFVYPNQTTGEQLTLVSTSANDTAAGSGTQQVDVHGLDYTGAEVHETVTMNGLTPVNTTRTDWRFVQYIHTQRVASGTIGTTAAGDITIYSTATPANIFNIIKAGSNISLSSQRMVPLGKTFYMDFILASVTAQKPVSARLRATCDFDGVITPGIFLYDEIIELESSGVPISLNVPRKFPALSIVKATGFSTIAGGTLAVSYGGWIE